MTRRIYAIGDIHGHLDQLVQLHDWIALDRERAGDTGAVIVHIGDLVDRGPDSFGVLEYLSDGHERGAPWVCVKGNHDRMFEGFLASADHRDSGLRRPMSWLSPNLGGASTLASYGIDVADYVDDHAVAEAARRRVPDRHLKFLRNLPLYHSVPGVVFVHAGIRPGVALADQSEDDLLWIRAPFLEDRRDHGMLVVHGHTPIDAATHYGNRINIDSGAAFGGPLSAIVIEDGQAQLIGPGGRQDLWQGRA